MKSQFSWLVISSTIACLSACSTVLAVAADTNIGPSDSFDGSTNSGTYTPKNTTTGVNYTLTGDVALQNLGGTTPLTNGCFSDTSEGLTFIGGGYSLYFKNIVSSADGAALSVSVSDKNLSLSGFSSLTFLATPSSVITTPTGKGAIKCGGNLTFTKNAKILVEQNYSEQDGGAINTKTFSLTGSTGSLSFIENKTATGKKGGAIYASSTVDITDNSAPILFSKNTADTSGGAINSGGNCTIKGNGSLVFSGNSVTATAGNGGAISGDADVTISGNQSITFSENQAVANGGAIYAKKLVLSSGGGGGISFSNNIVKNTTAGKGGAIAILSAGECNLSADQGDITFNGNTIAATTGNTTTRNAIDIGATAKFVNFRAMSGHSIFFYDPITANSTANSTDALNLNKADSGSSTIYDGSIVFSGEKLSVDEAKVSSNLLSTFKQPVTLTAGTLALKSGVTIDTNTFTQTAGSYVIMDAGTTLQASTGDIALTNLAVTVDSLGNGKKATISASAASKNVTLSGPITLVDNHGNAYENHKLGKTQDFSFVTLSAAGTVTTTDIPEVPTVATPTHYGYQGTWKMVWVNDGTSSPKTNTATLAWTNTGYLPNPERQGPLVPNSLWGSFSDIQAIQGVVERSALTLSSERGFWAAGVANFLDKDKKGEKRKYRHKSAGYAIGGSTQTPSDNLVSFAFCQLFGSDKDYLVAKNHTDTYAGTLYIQHITECNGFLCHLLDRLPGSWTNKPLTLEGQIAYSHISNDLKTKYTAYPEVKGSWGNNAFNMILGGSIHSYPRYIQYFDTYSPYIKLNLTYIRQDSFSEKGIEGRSFDDGNLFNLSLPIGVKFEKFSQSDDLSYDLTLSYIPDLIRNDPKCKTALVITGASWETYANNLARQALQVRAGSHYTFSPMFEVLGQFLFEVRGSSRIYNVDLGGKIQF
ncbi:Polymorphic membrane protein F,chlamydial polymorphic outer membrane protein repeat,Autotransporter beta-domain [Chlamydia serpentis]|uniref:Polymorphic membrane protein F,chlamydial polymorphic outer membrane protein repeat,Autotransporter beta-domain n=1 Tax=Chlamydia serpentis TaxID=1967782 RepID=A0A2R8FAX7_9CHLA|nr:autotransporter domain-containing protein [Chlamydia serpentis]SPN73583.1 Polymorphic membrane protein F,chlamydial polymorphic outer membrane protein repeat,Autotransporter beta-domain [Chlamydia serpentis]